MSLVGNPERNALPEEEVSRIPVSCEHLEVYERPMAWRITLFRVVCQSVCAAIRNAFQRDAGFMSSSFAQTAAGQLEHREGDELWREIAARRKINFEI